jgi:O-antigen/teichoic acid export membrane protein
MQSFSAPEDQLPPYSAKGAHVLRHIFSRDGMSRKARILLTFLAGQGSAQALNLIMGFLVLRWLDVGSYARYGLTYGFQTTTNILIDLGFAATIVALVGHRVGERAVIGNYVRAGRHLRLRMLAAVMPIAGIVFIFMTHRLQWTAATQIGLLLSILVSIYFSGLQAYYGSALVVTRRLGTYYRVQVCAFGGRLAGCALLHFAGHLNALSAVWINTAGLVGIALAYKAISRQLVEEPLRASLPVVRQMIRYVMPNIPGVIFYALQGQMALFLIAILGHTKGIAQVSALARLGQLFVMLTTFNGVVIEPWFARSTEEHVVPKYFVALAGAVAISVLSVGFSIIWPGALLWILGKNYQDLKIELAWTIASSCTSYLMALTWTVISARRLIYWSSTFLNIGLILAAQVGFIVVVGVSTTLRAVQFGFVSALASFLAQCINLTYGLKRGPRVSLTVDQAEESMAAAGSVLIS